MKGAPEIIIKRCKYYLSHGEKKPIDEEFIKNHDRN